MLHRTSSSSFVLLATSCGLAASFPVHAQGRAALVRDLDPRIQPSGRSGFIREIAPGRPLTFFAATEAAAGFELWCTDGTAAGTRMVMDLVHGSSTPRNLTWLNGVLYFLAEDEPYLTRLWRSDGTVAGTWRVSDQLVMAYLGDSRIAVVGERLVVVLDDSSVIGDRWIWTSDGTREGTRFVARTDKGGYLWRETAVIDRGLLFNYWDAKGVGPWVTDGTSAGTRMLTHLFPPLPVREFFAGLSDRAFFRALQPNNNSQLWTTDGTVLGTQRLARDLPGSWFWWGIGGAGRWSYLVARSELKWGHSVVWKSDGTPAGTAPFPAVPVGAWGIGALGDVMLFQTTPAPNTYLLNRTDGTAAGTRQLSAQRFVSVESPAVIMGGRAWFVADDGVHGGKLWVTDGTVAGTHQFVDLTPWQRYMAADDQRLWFPTDSQLWTSDGTVAGTRQVRDFDETAVSSWPSPILTNPDGTRAFGTTGATQDGWWQSDGTGTGTVRLDIGRTEHAVATWNASYFLALGAGQTTLRRSDAAGTRTVATLPALPMPQFLGTLGDDVLVVLGPALWRSDGTSSGTREFFRFPASLGGQPLLQPTPITLGNVRLFLTNNGLGSGELFRTDGTTAGTFSLASALPAGARVRSIARLHNAVFALVLVGTRQELWRTDAKAGGIVRVADMPDLPPCGFVGAAGDRMFLLAGSGERMFLMVTDGTAAGLRTIADLEVFNGLQPIPWDNGLLLAVHDRTHGSELWHSDGTTAGTRMLRDFVPGARSGFRSYGLTSLALPGARRVLISAFTDAAGMELWSTDGTPQGTTLVHDIRPGSLSSGPTGFALAGSTVVFAAYDDEHGRELWGIAAPAAVLPIGDGCRDTAGPGPLLRAGDAPLVGNGSFALELIEAQPGSPFWLALGTRARPTWLLPGCAWFVDDVVLVVGGAAGPNGRARVALPVPNDRALGGTSLYAQAVVAEAAPAVSSGVRVLFGTW